MADATSGVRLQTADGRPLKAALAQAQRKAKWGAFFLVAPLLAFVVFTFVIPILQMLERSAYNDGFSSNAPQLNAWFAAHPQGSAIDETAYVALVGDLAQMQMDKTAGQAGTRINYPIPARFQSSRRLRALWPPWLRPTKRR